MSYKESSPASSASSLALVLAFFVVLFVVLLATILVRMDAKEMMMNDGVVVATSAALGSSSGFQSTSVGGGGWGGGGGGGGGGVGPRELLGGGGSGGVPGAASVWPASPGVGPEDYARPRGLMLMAEEDDSSSGDRSGRLIDLRDFRFVQLPPDCPRRTSGEDEEVVLVLVHSAPGNSAHRAAIRATWGNTSALGTPFHLVFALGLDESPATQMRLRQEAALYGDILQGNFLDTYRNLTYKHAMGLGWAARRCSEARFILKTDDDVVVNPSLLLTSLRKSYGRGGQEGNHLVWCELQKKARVLRTYRSKWRVSFNEYHQYYYPPYCSGWAVVYGREAAVKLANVVQKAPYFWIDDVHLTGTLAQVTRADHRAFTNEEFNRPEHGPLEKKRGWRTSVIFHLVSGAPNQIYKEWSKIYGKVT